MTYSTGSMSSICASHMHLCAPICMHSLTALLRGRLALITWSAYHLRDCRGSPRRRRASCACLSWRGFSLEEVGIVVMRFRSQSFLHSLPKLSRWPKFHRVAGAQLPTIFRSRSITGWWCATQISPAVVTARHEATTAAAACKAP